MIERINIFELIGNSTTKYHSAILTTYTFDPIYFSTYYLSKLKSCGINNIIVMVDSANYDKVTDDYEHYGDVLHTGSYTLIRQQPSCRWSVSSKNSYADRTKRWSYVDRVR